MPQSLSQLTENCQHTASKKDKGKHLRTYELLIVTEKHFLGEEDVLFGRTHQTTVTQISSQAEWYRIKRDDFIDKFLFMANYRQIFKQAAENKLKDFAKKIANKETVNKKMEKST